MNIGPYQLDNALMVAPMAGVTDRPFRQLCKNLGAGYAVSEMVAANPKLRHTRKSTLRRDHGGEVEPIAVQIAGAEPQLLADFARENVREGAQIIDINMGCPAKKVCNKYAGSALLADEPLVKAILETVVDAVEVPVTLKIRTGPDPDNRNGLKIAEAAEAAGITMLAVHGRTRVEKYRGVAEYNTIRAIKQAVSIPVVANGDVDSPEKAREVLDCTGADGLMIGRGAQGNPWIFREIDHFLQTGRTLAAPSMLEVLEVMTSHLRNLHDFYGATQGVRIARKHIGWYLADIPGGRSLRKQLMPVTDANEQLSMIEGWFSSSAQRAA